MKSLKNRAYFISLTLLSVFVAMGISEVILRLLSPHKLSQKIVIEDSTLGYVHRPFARTVFHIDPKHSFDIRINNLGLRQDQDVGPKTDRDFRVLILGDSSVFGWGAAQKDTFFHLLEEKVQRAFPKEKIQLLNAGHGGWGQQQMLAYLHLKADELKPDFVFLVMGPQDVEDNQAVTLFQMNKEKQVLEFTPDRTTFQNNRGGIGKSRIYHWLMFNSMLLQLVRLPIIQIVQSLQLKKALLELKIAARAPALINPQSFPETDIHQGFDLTCDLFRHLKSLCLSNSWYCSVTNIGHGSYHTASFFDYEEPFFVRERIPYKNMFPIIFPQISKSPDTYLLKNDSHFNAEGHALYAEAVWPFFRGQLVEALKLRKQSRVSLRK